MRKQFIDKGPLESPAFLNTRKKEAQKSAIQFQYWMAQPLSPS
jgi:hypothetical protein